MINRFPKILALSGLVFLASPGPAQAQVCVPPPGIGGLWIGNDNGNYYVRVVGNEVWWVGLDANTDGAGWTHAFKGTRNGQIITGRWADVRGNVGTGALTLRIEGLTMRSIASSNPNFGGSLWTRPDC